MSLIADALKAAQDEKRKKMAPPRARGGGSSYFPLRGGARAARRFSLPLIGAVGVLVPAALVAAVIMARGNDQPVRAAAPIIPPIQTPPGDSVLVDTAVSSPASDETPVPSEPAEAAADEPADEPSPASRPARRPARRTVASPPPEVAGGASVADASRPVTRSPAVVTSQINSAPTGLQITLDRSASSNADAVFQDALAAQRSGEHVRARDLYLRVIQLQPNHAEAHNNLGAVHRALGDLAAAEGSYRRAVAADARFAPAWSNLGAMLGRMGRTREAIEALQRAIQIEPNNLGAKVNLAIQYDASGLNTEAKRLLDEVLRADPSHAEAHYQLARNLETARDRNGAIRHYQLFLSTGAGRFPQLEETVRRHLRTLGAR